MISFVLETNIDNNFDNMKETIIFSVVPRAMTLIAVAAIFTMLSARTAKLLGNLMGASEQKAMLERMQRMQTQNSKVSKELQKLMGGVVCTYGNVQCE